MLDADHIKLHLRLVVEDETTHQEEVEVRRGRAWEGRCLLSRLTNLRNDASAQSHAFS
jgi:hypothetical protein